MYRFRESIWRRLLRPLLFMLPFGLAYQFLAWLLDWPPPSECRACPAHYVSDLHRFASHTILFCSYVSATWIAIIVWDHRNRKD